MLFGFLIVSGASATASLVNGTVNGSIEIPPDTYSLKRPGDRVKPKFFQAIEVGIEIIVGGTELLVLTVSLATLAVKGLYEVIKKYGGKVAEFILKATGFKQLAEFGDGFIGTAGYSMEHPRVQVYLKKIWIFPTPLADKLVIKDGSRTVVEVKKSELDQVDDLFSPKEYGKLLAQAYLNGWDANDAKKLAEDFDREYRGGFRAHFNGGANLDCGVFEGGDVIIDAKGGAKHIIFNHIMKKPGKDQFTHISAVDLLNEMGKVIENPDKIKCGDIISGKQRIVLVKYSPPKLGKKVVVVIERIKWGMYRIVTAFPPSSRRY
ncbi:hypothetical protein [Thermococcus sp. JCM 11816]|uniref:hypothetical protein n=1 Tax=Thermococcus sp. (strain JCM 11816 / KS-1) TaxID=1295125 RepID=UPI0006D1A648